MALNEKQARFAAEYIVDLNATQAALRAGYSKKTAYSQGHDLLKHPEVGAEIQRLKSARSARTEVSADAVVSELSRIAFSDVTEIVSGGAGAVLYVRELSTLPEHVRRCIAEVSETQGPDGSGTLKVKLHSKVQALRMLMDHLGMDAAKKVDGTIAVRTVSPEEGAELARKAFEAAALAAAENARRGR